MSIKKQKSPKVQDHEEKRRDEEATQEEQNQGEPKPQQEDLRDCAPVLMYKSPGSHQAPGGTFDYRQVRDKTSGEEAVRGGWSLTVSEAIERSK